MKRYAGLFYLYRKLGRGRFELPLIMAVALVIVEVIGIYWPGYPKGNAGYFRDFFGYFVAVDYLVLMALAALFTVSFGVLGPELGGLEFHFSLPYSRDQLFLSRFLSGIAVILMTAATCLVMFAVLVPQALTRDPVPTSFSHDLFAGLTLFAVYFYALNFATMSRMRSQAVGLLVSTILAIAIPFVPILIGGLVEYFFDFDESRRWERAQFLGNHLLAFAVTIVLVTTVVAFLVARRAFHRIESEAHG